MLVKIALHIKQPILTKAEKTNRLTGITKAIIEDLQIPLTNPVNPINPGSDLFCFSVEMPTPV